MTENIVLHQLTYFRYQYSYLSVQSQEAFVEGFFLKETA